MRLVFCTLLSVFILVSSSLAARPWGGVASSQKVQCCSNDCKKENKQEMEHAVEEDEEINHMLQGCNLAIRTRKDQLFFQKGEVLVRKIRPVDESEDKSHLTTSKTARWV
mmetsp:Transcript_23099/g.35040  ORF Transcript_23099/g.35040 Transcript_23099/m.35040 type:complete len:110 (-) Transcript_23099:415-744(-)